MLLKAALPCALLEVGRCRHLEAVALSMIGGLIGLGLGIVGAFLMGGVGGWPTAIPAWALILSMGFSVAIGLVFGVYPSWRAAQLDPIEALRRQ